VEQETLQRAWRRVPGTAVVTMIGAQAFVLSPPVTGMCAAKEALLYSSKSALPT